MTLSRWKRGWQEPRDSGGVGVALAMRVPCVPALTQAGGDTCHRVKKSCGCKGMSRHKSQIKTGPSGSHNLLVFPTKHIS